jgi:hypothetical protein
MPSPFPGMDPYLEGYLWPDVHHRLATEISDQLGDLIEPRYVARIEMRMVKDHVEPSELGIMFPDVEIAPSPLPSTPIEWSSRLTGVPTISPPELVVPITIPIDTPVNSVEIRDAKSNTLVTSIEILSPVNKRGPGVDEYRAKRERVMDANAHLLEIDLLRRGTHSAPIDNLPNAPYFVFLTRAGRPLLEIWPIQLRAALQVLPVPLRYPDPDVPLDLGAVLQAIYKRAHYDASIDYREEPDIPLSKDDAAWADEWLRKAGRR